MDGFILELLESLPDHDLLLLGLLLPDLLPPLALLQLLSLDVLLEALAGLAFELVELLDVAAELLELVDMVDESHLLRKRRGTSSAVSRCSALMVFLLLS